MKQNNFKKYFLSFWLILAIIGVFFFARQVSAVNKNLEISYTGQPGPLFSESEFYPLKSVEKQLLVKNLSEDDQSFAFRISSIIGDTPLSDVLVLQVKNAGNILLEDNLSNLKNDNERFIDTINAQTTINYTFRVFMQDVGNEYQNLQIETSDFVVGFSTNGQVLGDNDTVGDILGDKISLSSLSRVGSNIILTILYAFIIASIMFIIQDKKKRKKLIKIWRKFKFNL